ncbi:hypothetical protein HGI30_15020 [Paenibacillus albicereus]|uniref:Uncharacterized protein n=1 Tax=Paenibacillus albicereus TaxID=2726185 RepID=A0A6H2GZ81_9BACL|nr:hypothetical protein [Paenibacillus albicereus]QJC52744.1 hypothetical protein HGI30_15020 [Paenibacillus albicereus]
MEEAMRFVGVDPATKTGFVALDYDGSILEELELIGAGEKGKGREISMPQLVDLENQLYRLLKPGDEIVIEQAAAKTQKPLTTGALHGGLRSMIIRRQLRYNEINPIWTKQYVGVTGWTGETGNKRRLTGPEKKAEVKRASIQHFGYPVAGLKRSDNIIDAYIIARAALNLYRMRELQPLLDTLPYQVDVTTKILHNA